MNRFLGLVVLALLCVAGFFVWQHYHQQRMEYSGEVTCQGCMTPQEKDAFLKENAGETSDGQSEHKIRTAAQDAKAGFPDANAPVNGTPVTQANASATGVQAAPVNPVAPQPALKSVPQTMAAAPMAQATNPPAGPMPMSDSQPVNAPNGMRFAGSGTYQWYRQGNLTWRIDTTTGRSCIIYATMEEWQKQVVYSHGCGRSA